jgi:all-trans-8'-apo-beta-carotenal 15,15'-oxygenase
MSRSALYCDVPREHGFEALEVEGDLPAELRGTLYRNGPGLFGSHGRRYGHLFEGQGAISAVRFADGGAAGAIRVVESDALREERAAGRPLYGSATSRVRRIGNALRQRSSNGSNVSVLAWQERVFGVVDLAKPIEVRRRRSRRSARPISTARSPGPSPRTHRVATRTRSTASASATGARPSSISTSCRRGAARGAWGRFRSPRP